MCEFRLLYQRVYLLCRLWSGWKSCCGDNSHVKIQKERNQDEFLTPKKKNIGKKPRLWVTNITDLTPPGVILCSSSLLPPAMALLDPSTFALLCPLTSLHRICQILFHKRLSKPGKVLLTQRENKRFFVLISVLSSKGPTSFSTAGRNVFSSFP